MFNFRRHVAETKSHVIPVTLKLKTTLPSGTLLCPTYKRELRHIPNDCNYIQGEYLKSENLTCLLVALY